MSRASVGRSSVDRMGIMTESRMMDTAESADGCDLPQTAPGRSFRDGLVGIAVIGGGALVTFLWVAILVYVLILILV